MERRKRPGIGERDIRRWSCSSVTLIKRSRCSVIMRYAERSRGMVRGGRGAEGGVEEEAGACQGQARPWQGPRPRTRSVVESRALRKAGNGVEVHSAAARHEYRHEYPRWTRWTCVIPSVFFRPGGPAYTSVLRALSSGKDTSCSSPALYYRERVAFLSVPSIATAASRSRPFHFSRYVSITSR